MTRVSISTAPITLDDTESVYRGLGIERIPVAEFSNAALEEAEAQMEAALRYMQERVLREFFRVEPADYVFRDGDFTVDIKHEQYDFYDRQPFRDDPTPRPTAITVATAAVVTSVLAIEYLRRRKQLVAAEEADREGLLRDFVAWFERWMVQVRRMFG